MSCPFARTQSTVDADRYDQSPEGRLTWRPRKLELSASRTATERLVIDEKGRLVDRGALGGTDEDGSEARYAEHVHADGSLVGGQVRRQPILDDSGRVAVDGGHG